MQVVAIAKGYYGGKIREVGEEFEISSPNLLGKWMKEVVKAAPVSAPVAAEKPARGRSRVEAPVEAVAETKVEEEVM
jgi:transposase-like protein